MTNARLDALIDWFESLTPSSVDRVGEFYAENARFEDPFNAVTGRAAIAHIFHEMFRQVTSPRFCIEETYVEGDRVMLLWRFTFVARWPRRPMIIEGATRLAFDGGGKVVAHRDYWDVAGELYSRMPGLGCLMRGLQRLGRA